MANISSRTSSRSPEIGGWSTSHRFSQQFCGMVLKKHTSILAGQLLTCQAKLYNSLLQSSLLSRSVVGSMIQGNTTEYTVSESRVRGRKHAAFRRSNVLRSFARLQTASSDHCSVCADILAARGMTAWSVTRNRQWKNLWEGESHKTRAVVVTVNPMTLNHLGRSLLLWCWTVPCR
jgi:hypothetical protein